MLLYRPRFTEPPVPDRPEPPVDVRTPEGAVREAGDPALCEELTSTLGHPVFLLKRARGIFDTQHISVCGLAGVRQLSTQPGSAIRRPAFRACVYIVPA